MPIEVQCHSCDEFFEVSRKAASRSIRCPHCNKLLTVPKEGRQHVEEPQPTEPWYYKFLQTYAQVAMVLSILVGIVVTLNALSSVNQPGSAWGLLFGPLLAIAGISHAAFLHLLVDIGTRSGRHDEQEAGD
jgi:hypothetical protein